MALHLEFTDRFETPAATDVVSFSVVCTPRSDASLEQLLAELSVRTVNRFLPGDDVQETVRRRLEALGFQVFREDRGPCVSGIGRQDRFEAVFRTRLVKRIRTVSADSGEYVQISLTVPADANQPDPGVLPGALLICVAEPPVFLEERLPPLPVTFTLHLPGDVAQMLGASAAHRRSVAGRQATGAGVRVAMLDTGFAYHPFYTDYRYRVRRTTAAGAEKPASADPRPHGTLHLANIFACAPDADVHAIKMGTNPVLAFDRAMTLSSRVVVCSWAHDFGRRRTLPAQHVALWLRIVEVIAQGVTVVCAAGTGASQSFPAMIPEVLAVGGVAVDDKDAVSVWANAPSFTSRIYRRRRVPDICGIASDMMLPTGGKKWRATGGTSSAAPQVAGICALLLQKDPTLTPPQIRRVLRNTAADVTLGKSASGHSARKGPDLASGSGLVDAQAAWEAVHASVR